VRLAAVLDCCCVLAFVLIGRASHADGVPLRLGRSRCDARDARV